MAIRNALGTVKINGSNFIGNNANGGGDAVFNEKRVSPNPNASTITITSSKFNGNTASHNSGAILTLHDLTTLKYNNITNNRASHYGSAIYNSGHDIYVYYNNIVANPGNNEIYSPNNLYTPANAKYLVYAQENWWGSDDNPSNYVSIAGNSVMVDNWLTSPHTYE